MSEGKKFHALSPKELKKLFLKCKDSLYEITLWQKGDNDKVSFPIISFSEKEKSAAIPLANEFCEKEVLFNFILKGSIYFGSGLIKKNNDEMVLSKWNSLYRLEEESHIV